jgi:hypothetical protein
MLGFTALHPTYGSMNFWQIAEQFDRLVMSRGVIPNQTLLHTLALTLNPSPEGERDFESCSPSSSGEGLGMRGLRYAAAIV